MSDRINGFIVVLDKDYKDEDIEPTIKAIEQIKGVIAVKPNIVTADDYIAKERTKIEIVNKLYDFTQQILGEKK
jgi:nitrate reductase NapAB chaperone NapD